jgi:hypothetical protein
MLLLTGTGYGTAHRAAGHSRCVGGASGSSYTTTLDANAAWGLIKILPAHPIITAAVGVATTGRTKPAVSNGISELLNAGILTPLTTSPRNRAWEAAGLLDLIEELESG